MPLHLNPLLVSDRLTPLSFLWAPQPPCGSYVLSRPLAMSGPGRLRLGVLSAQSVVVREFDAMASSCLMRCICASGYRLRPVSQSDLVHFSTSLHWTTDHEPAN
jgi:hypothetical protein